MMSSVTVCKTVSKENETVFPFPQIAVMDWEQGLSSGAGTAASAVWTEGLTALLMGAVVHTGMGSKADKNIYKKKTGMKQMRFFSLEKIKRGLNGIWQKPVK